MSATTDQSLPADVGVEQHADHAVLHPPETVKERAYIAARRGDPTPEQVLGRADKELEEASVDFHDWMIEETANLANARAYYRTHGPTPDALRNLFQAAHTIRGDAGVFGYPLAGNVADSLSKLLDGAQPDKLPAVLIDQHVDAIRAIVREDARGADNRNARALALALIDMASKYAPPATAADAGRESNAAA